MLYFVFLFFVFFFSSRRRHTRYIGDWSSDVCSSDLTSPSLCIGKILRNNPGLTARVLSRRLRQMQSEGLVERIADGDSVRRSEERRVGKECSSRGATAY